MKCGITTTLETVSIHRPDRIDFRLVRGPVPHLVESAATRRRFARATDVSSCDLRGELSRRDEHEGTDAGVALAETLRDRDRDRKRERLARPGRRAHENVQTGERVGENRRLDPKRDVGFPRSERIDQGLAHREVAKRLLDYDVRLLCLLETV